MCSCSVASSVDRNDFLRLWLVHPAFCSAFFNRFVTRRCYVVGCKGIWGRTKQLHKQRRESFQSMIESDSCQIDSNIHTPQRTESSLRTPGPDNIIERFILILSSTQHTPFQKLPLGQLSQHWLYEGNQILWQLRSMLGRFFIIRKCTIEFAP